MKKYKDENNQVYAFELDGSQDEFISDNLVQITDEEAERLTYLPETKELQIEIAELKKRDLILEATMVIEPLQDASSFGIATPNELDKLNKMKLYRIELTRLDTSLAPDVKFPDMPI